METCAKCRQPMICGHAVMIDVRIHCRLCCLCTAELIAALGQVPEEAR